ncbi:STAS domain-containing protein [Novosphingobium sp. G106]|uniref:SulP family inorganic anion transporter n=1 Tax=Novosphingobium sp. G106 TaxID=2849500 RepID=UPI001C2DC841|nr:SulP family inorganic anion transporter [Novosphingobium sp. G106]MBV1686598.1 STAS domain-containing protein [Novosphingobium sp. G106]
MPEATGNSTRVRDAVTGLSIAGLMLPEGIAYAQIAVLAPGRALIAAVAGGLAYALIGRSRFAVVSPTSSAAAILAASLASLPGDAAMREAAATALVAIVGLLFLGFALFRLGSLASFISRPVLHGFAFGLALTIIIGQLPKLTGVGAASGPIWTKLAALAATAPQWHVASLLLGAGALAALLALRRLPQVPAALVVILGGIALDRFADLDALGIATAGKITLELPRFAMSANLPDWMLLVELAAPIALILFAESWGTMRALALKHGDRIAANRELGALGAANLAAAAVQGMPVGAGFSAGSANEAAGAASRLSAAVGAAALLLLALFAGEWIARIPEPILAAVVIAALTHALSPMPFARLFRINRDQGTALAAAAGVLAFGVLDGMLVAVALSIANLLYDLAHPSISELGRVGDSHDFVDIARHKEARALPGLAIFRPNAPLIFANAESVLFAIAERALKRDAHCVVLSLEESNDLDSTAADALGEFSSQLDKAGRHVILARVHDRVREVLDKDGLDNLAAGSTFSVADAAALAEKESR